MKKNKNLIIVSINDSFFAVLNPSIKNGLRVLNKSQLKILEEIEDYRSNEDLALALNSPISEVTKCIDLLYEKKFIGKEYDFTPQPRPSPSTLNFWIHTTNQCNLRCSYCNIPTLGQNDVLEEDTINKLFDQIIASCKKWKLSKVSLRLAGGEPLLRFRVWKQKFSILKSRLQQINVELQISFLTNLVALNDEMIDFIKHEHIGIGVSLDGLYQFQDSTRHFKNGGGSFKIVARNLDRLLEAGITPGIMTVVSNSNLDGLLDLTRFLISKNLHFRYSFVQGIPLDIEKTRKVLDLCYKEFEVAIKEAGYQFTQKHTLCDLKFLNPFFQTCSNGFSGGAVYTNGDIYFCQTQFETKNSIGSVFEDSDLLTTLQKGSHYETANKDCILCKYQSICTSGCPLEREKGKDPHCVLYKDFIPKIIRLMGMQRLVAVLKSNNYGMFENWF